MVKPSAEKHARIRGLILRALAPGHPKPEDIVVLRRVIADLGYPVDEDDMESYVHYLEEKGYVRTEVKERFKITMVNITAKGLDVLDERIVDPGIDSEV